MSRCIAGIMAKPFVICHDEQTEKRDRIALIALACMRRVCVCRSRALCFHYCVSLSLSLGRVLLFSSFHPSTMRRAVCIICSKISAIIIGRPAGRYYWPARIDIVSGRVDINYDRMQ